LILNQFCEILVKKIFKPIILVVKNLQIDRVESKDLRILLDINSNLKIVSPTSLYHSSRSKIPKNLNINNLIEETRNNFKFFYFLN